VLEQARRRYRFVVIGYVVMPEHIHLLISEPEIGDPSVVMKVVKPRSARMLRGRRASEGQSRLWPDENRDNVWQKPFIRWGWERTIAAISTTSLSLPGSRCCR
jgi:REP element-mobilizing transposase RayT